MKLLHEILFAALAVAALSTAERQVTNELILRMKEVIQGLREISNTMWRKYPGRAFLKVNFNTGVYDTHLPIGEFHCRIDHAPVAETQDNHKVMDELMQAIMELEARTGYSSINQCDDKILAARGGFNCTLLLKPDEELEE